MSKRKTILSFFRKEEQASNQSQIGDSSSSGIDPIINEVSEQLPKISETSHSDIPTMQSKVPHVRCQFEHIDIASLERDPGLRPSIWEYPINQRDEIRRAYIIFGPYQHVQTEYPYSNDSSGHRRCFQSQWFSNFSWLEYSPVKDACYCLPCYLFGKKPIGKCGSDAFTVKGFRNWKKVSDALIAHMGKDASSAHNYAVSCYENLKNFGCHIENVVERQTTQQIASNRLRLKTSIDVARFLLFQALAFRGHDECSDSANQGNFLEMIKLLASYNESVNETVLHNAPQNAKYTSPRIQKEIVHVFARNVQKKIREELGDAKFCLLVDEARDESKKEQMAIVLRFVDHDGFIRERFLDLVHVESTTATTLKSGIDSVLSHHGLDIRNMRGQGYDGASNMRGEWNGLQALIRQDCPYAYYVHCLAHQLQLALVTSSKEVSEVHEFFKQVNFIINIVCGSTKRNDRLKALHAEEIEHLISIEELDTGRGLNQIGTLQRPGDTRWSSHFKSICRIIDMFSATCGVLRKAATEGNYSQRGDALSALKRLSSFEFIFILHVMKEIMGITDMLCQILQQKSLDILHAMTLVSTTKLLIQKLRDDGWENLFENVKSFCIRHDVDIPDMTARYTDILRKRNKVDVVSVEHHYRVDIFVRAVDQQLQELNNRFSEQSAELLALSSSLEPKNNFSSFDAANICTLVEKYYPQDFSHHEKVLLRYQLEHYKLDVPNDAELKSVITIADLCQGLFRRGKSHVYPLIDRLLRLILTLPVSTATTERAFSAMNLVKTRLRNSIGDEFLRDCLIVHIEREVAKEFSVDAIIEDFTSMKERRAQFKK